MNPRTFLSAAAIAAFALTLTAQTPAVAPTTGTVTGHITCADTQRPARFAQVVLFGVPAEVDTTPAPKADLTDMAAAMKQVRHAMGGLNMAQGQTDMNGDFNMTNVTPGDYYLFGVVGGYVSPQAQVQAAVDAGADVSKPIPGIPIVHVIAGRTAQGNVAIERGASVTGRVVWDDGAPIAHVIVTAVDPTGKKKELPPQLTMLAMAGAMNGAGAAITNDIGEYRLAGLAPGDYVVKASMTMNAGFAMKNGSMDISGMLGALPLDVYAPAALHLTAAKPVTVKAADEVSDLTVTFNLAGMHTVSGSITSAEDHHMLNAGTVKLTDTSDEKFMRSARVETNGSFTVKFVPAGTYTLEVSDGADTEPAKEKGKGFLAMSLSGDHTLRSYEDKKTTVIVLDSDLTGQDMALSPSKKTKEDFDFKKLMEDDDDDKKK